jgi:hypothetical protein
MSRLLAWTVFLALTGCRQGHGERCNPMRATTDCDPGLSCVFPTGPNCGVSYCCQVDSQGRIVDSIPTCQPDPESAAACGIDLGVPSDGGSRD